MKRIALLCLVSYATICAQTSSTGAATATGSCNVAVSGSGNTIKIQTCGMTKAQVEEWRSSFRQILNKQIDPKILVALLDDIKSGQIRIENGVLRIENKVAEIQAKQKGRALSDQQQEELASAMARFGPQTITFDPRRANEEVSLLVQSIAKPLSRVGIKMEDAGNDIVAFPPPGIAILYTSDRGATAMALSKALAAFGIPNNIRPIDGPSAIRVRFGPKPEQ